MDLLLVDNNDSFTYNIAELLRGIGGELRVDVVRSEALSPAVLPRYRRVILSPGPGTPEDFPVMAEVIGRCHARGTPLLGICLGHQALCRYFGGHLVRLGHPRHGRRLAVHIDPCCPLYAGIPARTEVGVYHSWAVEAARLPACLAVTGRTGDQVLMSVRHREQPLYGVQFHPESFLTAHGRRMLENFIGP